MNTAKEIRANILELLFKLNDIKKLKSIQQKVESIYNTAAEKNNNK